MTSIQAFETDYDNYLFRSRLEARWAVFFNALKVPYRYELEGYRIGRGYLPDFYLPQINTYFEIKPFDASDDAFNKVLALCVGLFRRKDYPSTPKVALIEGDPFQPSVHIFHCMPWLPGNKPRDLVDSMQHKSIFPEFRDSVEYMDEDFFCYHFYWPMGWSSSSGNWSPVHAQFMRKEDKPIVLSAARKARQARFEHGERP